MSSRHGVGQARDVHLSLTASVYRAPELLFGPARYDPSKIDLWALGCVLAEFLLLPVSGEKDHAEDMFDPLEDESDVDLPERSVQTRATLFTASFGDIGLAASIFRIRGSPQYTWPVRPPPSAFT